MNNIILAVSRVFAVSVLVIGSVNAAPTETDSLIAGQSSVEESIASYRKVNPTAHRGRPAMRHEPKGKKSRRTLPAVAGPSGSKRGATLPSGKKN